MEHYHYFYRITNNLNGHFYYGIHSTNNLNDDYMGSGKRLHYAYKKYSMENFTKEILKFFDTRKEASDYEAEMVTEALIEDDNCYNIRLGGDNGRTCGTIIAIDENGKWLRCKPTDENVLSGKWKHFLKGKMVVYDTEMGRNRSINKTEFLSNTVRYVSPFKGRVPVVDKNGHYYIVSVDDERIKSGEFRQIWEGRHHTEESKNKMRETHKINGHQKR